MSELLVQLTDSQTTGDSGQDAFLPMRGDVIVTSDVWGQFELSKSNWRIIDCPDVSESDASVFTSPQLSTSLDDERAPTRYRGFYLDLGAMVEAIEGFRDWLADDTRASSSFRISGSLDPYKLRHEPASNPAVIGQSRKIIG